MSAPLVDVLGKFREKDEKSKQGETLPEQETLNNARLRSYLDENGVKADNFDTLFKLPQALDFLDKGSTKGEQEMAFIIREGQAYFTKIGRPDLIEDKSPASFNSTLKKELMRRQELDKMGKLQQAYLAYQTVRELAFRSLNIREHFSKKLDEQKTSTEKGLKEEFAGVIEDVKKNYAKMSSGEKLLAVGSLIFGAIYIMKSDNENVKKIKDYIFTGLKIAGLGVGINYVTKLITGKTAVDTLSDLTKDTASKDSFWTETYKTDGKGAEILQKSTVYLADKDFMYLSKEYAKAKADGTHKIKVPGVNEKDMSQEEVYMALDTFFGRYPAEKLEPRFRNAKPDDRKWIDVVSTCMAEDGLLEFKGDFFQSAVESVKEYSVRGWNWFWVNEEGFGIMRSLYLKVRGTDGTKEEIRDWAEKNLKQHLQNEVLKEDELHAFIDRNFSPESAKNYHELLRSGVADTVEPAVKLLEVPGDSMYMMSTVKIDASTATDKTITDTLNKSLRQAEDFLKRKYPEAADNLYKFIEIPKGVRVAEDSSFRLFVRMPLKGSAEYSRKAVMLDKPPVRDEKRSAETFTPDSKLDYNDMLQNSPWQADALRLRFMMDATQTGDLQKILDWFKDQYKGRNMSRADVEKKIFESDEDRTKALEQSGVTQKLTGMEAFYSKIDADLKSREESAAAKFDTTILSKLYPPNWFNDPSDAQLVLVEEMKRNMGYKVRLAAIGDSGALAFFKSLDPVRYDPQRRESWLTKLRNSLPGDEINWMSDLMSDYEKRCNQLVEQYSKGQVKFTK